MKSVIKKLSAITAASLVLVSCGTDEWESEDIQKNAYESYLCNKALHQDGVAYDVLAEILGNKDQYSAADIHTALDASLYLTGAKALNGSKTKINPDGEEACSGWLWEMYHRQNWDEDEMKNFKPSDAREAGIMRSNS